jgi:tetratricopeptide (TPR) repeat protein
VVQRRLRGWCLLALFGGEGTGQEEDRRQRALAAAREALSRDPSDVDALLAAAFSSYWSRIERGKDEGGVLATEVARLRGEVLALDPEDGAAQGLLAVMALVRGETARALELVRKLQGLSERDPLVNFLENYTLWALGRNAELLATLETQAAEATSRYEQAYRMGCRAEVLAREGRHREAVAAYERALELDPDRSWLENFRCMRLFQLGELERAVECYRALASRGVDVYVRQLAQALVALGRPSEAVSAACEALATNPWKDPAQRELIHLVREHGDEMLPDDVAGLLGSLEEASRAAMSNPRVLTTLAFFRLHGPGARDLEQVRQAISRALEMPGKPEAESLVVLAEIYHADGDLGAAIRKLEEALRLPGASKAHRRLLDRWRQDSLPDLPSYASIEAALAARRPGSDEDLALLTRFPREPGDTGGERRFAYLEARLLARSGQPAEAAAKLAALAGTLEDPDPELALRLSECLVASGAAEAAEAHLRRRLEGGGAPRELWYAWLDLALSRLGWSPGDCLARLAAGGEEGVLGDLRWLLAELSTGALRIDCAGTEEHTSPSGRRWGRDRFFRGGSASVYAGGPWGRPAVRGSPDEWLYAMSRWFEPDEDRPGYAIPVPRGSYSVTLHFCEGWSAAPGLRVFDIRIEGETVLAGYDGFARSGFGVAASESFEAAVEDGLLEIELRAQKGGADLAAIEVERWEGR